MSIAEKPKNPTMPPCDHIPVAYEGPSKEEVLAVRKQYLTPGLITYYRDPLLVVEGHMQYLWDERGKRYLDAFAGIVTVSVGHCHPYVVEKVRDRLESAAAAVEAQAPMVAGLTRRLIETLSNLGI